MPGNRNNNPLLAVDKKSAGVVAFDDIRLCIDARQLNTLNRTKKRTYVLPRIADILKKAQKVTFMADLDLKAAFHQFLLDVRSSELSAFTSPCDGSRQQMTRMWFGEEGASDHCQMIVERVMGLREEGTEDWDLFVDNSYMFFTGSDIRKFAESVARLIRKFTEAGLKLNRKKCKIGFVRMQVLGFLCEKGQCSVDLNKLECFKKMKKPKGQQELASLLGFTNFLRDQILLYSQVVGPLQQIASKKNWDKNTWGPDQEAAFSRLKTALLKVPVVHQPDMDKAFHVSTDASQHGVGAVLYQVVNGEKKYVSFMSKALKKGQRNYSATKRELLAIVYALKRWEPFFGRDEIQCRNRPQSTIIPTQRKIAHGEGLGQIPIHFRFHSFPHTRCGQHPTTLPFTPGRTHRRAHPRRRTKRSSNRRNSPHRTYPDNQSSPRRNE